MGGGAGGRVGVGGGGGWRKGGGGGMERATGDAWMPGYTGTVKRQSFQSSGSILPSFLSPWIHAP